MQGLRVQFSCSAFMPDDERARAQSVDCGRPEWTSALPIGILMIQYLTVQWTGKAESLAHTHRLPDFSRRCLGQEKRQLHRSAIRGACCRRKGTLRNDLVPREGGLPLGNDQHCRSAPTRRGIEGYFSATRSGSPADNKSCGWRVESLSTKR
jgi:hypothetical protein